MPFGTARFPSIDELLGENGGPADKMNGMKEVVITRIPEGERFSVGGEMLKFKVSAGPARFDKATSKSEARRKAKKMKREVGAERIVDKT